MSSNDTMVGDGHDCGNPCRITTWFDGRQRVACGCGYIVSDEPHEPDPFNRMRDEKAALETDLATLRRKLDGLTKEVRTVMSIAPDETAMPGCECQRCRIIRALDGAAGMEGKEL